MMFASAESFPTLVARKVKLPVLLIVAPITASPSNFSTGMDSPVIIDSSTLLVPLVRMPSTGIFSPGRTITMLAETTSSTGMSISIPWRITRAVLACSPISFLMASDVFPLALTSSAIPRTTSATTTVATSQNASASACSGNHWGNNTAIVEYKKAAEMPEAIRVCMFAVLCFSADHIPL